MVYLREFIKHDDRLLTFKVHYFQPMLANCRVDIKIFILYLDLYRMEREGA